MIQTNNKPKQYPRKAYSKMTKISHNPTTPGFNPFSPQEPIPELTEDVTKNTDHDQMESEIKFKSFSNMFYSTIPPQLLFDVLEQVCIIRDEYYIFNILAFRSLKYRNLYPAFANHILSYYRPHYQSFVTRPLTYKSFVTILRHICKMNNIRFDCKDNYSSPGYNIDYYVYKT